MISSHPIELLKALHGKVLECKSTFLARWARGEMSSRTETYDKPIFNTSIARKETVPIEGSKI
jgi:hypothetical protein